MIQKRDVLDSEIAKIAAEIQTLKMLTDNQCY